MTATPPLDEPGTPPAEEPVLSVRANLAWNTTGMVAARLMSIGFGVVLARLLVPTAYGVFAIVYGAMGIGVVFSNIGVAAAFIHRRKHVRENAAAAFWMNSIVALLLAGVLLASSKPLAGFYGNQAIASMMPVIVLAFLAQVLVAIHQANLQRALSYRRLQAINVVGVLAFGVSAVAMAAAGLGPWSLVLGLTLSNLVQAGLVLAFAGLPMSWNPHLDRWRDLLSFSRWVFLAGLLVTLVSQLDNLSVGRFLGTKQLGYYALAYSYGVAPTALVGAAIAQVMFAAFSRAEGDVERIRTLFERAVSRSAMVAFPLAGLLWLVGANALVLVVGARWAPAAQPFRVLVTINSAALVACIWPSLFYALDLGVVNALLEAAALVFLVAVLAVTLHIGILAVAIGVATLMGLLAVCGLVAAAWRLSLSAKRLVRGVAPIVVAVILASIFSELVRNAVSLRGPLGDLLLPTAVYTCAFLLSLRVLFPSTWRGYLDEVGMVFHAVSWRQ